MNELWSSNKLHKIFSKDSLAMTINAHASGDGSTITRLCRLCGGDTSLRSFAETYTCDGIEERYDQLMYNCFSVRVFPPDSLICDHCVRQLRNINRFRSLVYTAFVKQCSQYSSKHSQLGVGEGYKSLSNIRDNEKTINRLKEVVKMRKRKTESIDTPKKREVRRDRRLNSISKNSVVKRMNIACIMCKQRYPMIVPFEGWKEFVCSRCKKKGQAKSGIKRCKLKMATSVIREHFAMDSKTDDKGRNGVNSSSKRSTQLSRTEITSRVQQQKYYECSLCPKKYVVAQHLVHHVNTVHRETESVRCTGKDMADKGALDKRRRMHTGQPVYQCDVCLRTFKGKRSFQAHYSTHGK